jgi:tRNA(Ile)-lysidine synthase
MRRPDPLSPAAALLLERFRATLDDLVRGEPPTGFVVAVSGGADSTALARLFALWRDAGGAAPLLFGHLHHGIRGAEADGDAEFVRGLSADLGVEFVCAKADVPGLARRRGESIELAGRGERYRRLGEWAAARGYNYVVTAHHQDDQRETVLLRIVRGTGLRGLGGIRARRRLRSSATPRVHLVRPLLGWRRRELAALLAELDQPHREDATNCAASTPRNAVRHRVLPLLEAQVHPGAGAALDRLAALARELHADVERLVDDAWPGVQRPEADRPHRVVLARGALARLPATLREGVLARAMDELSSRAGEAAPPLSRAQRREIGRRLLGATVTGDEVRVGRHWRLRTDGDRLEIEWHGAGADRGAGAPRVAPPPPAALAVPGEAAWSAWRIGVEPLDDAAVQRLHRQGVADQGPLCELVALDSLGGPLVVRGRRRGESFRALGAPGRKKLKEFLRECGVPPSARDTQPLVVSPRGIVWVVGHRIGHAFRVTPESQRVALLRAEQAR